MALDRQREHLTWKPVGKYTDIQQSWGRQKGDQTSTERIDNQLEMIRSGGERGSCTKERGKTTLKLPLSPLLHSIMREIASG